MMTRRRIISALTLIIIAQFFLHCKPGSDETAGLLTGVATISELLNNPPAVEPGLTADLTIAIDGVSGDGEYIVVDFTVTNSGNITVDFSSNPIFVGLWSDMVAAPSIGLTAQGITYLQFGTIAGGGGTISETAMFPGTATVGNAYAAIDNGDNLTELDENNNISSVYPWSGGSPAYYVFETRLTGLGPVDTVIFLTYETDFTVRSCAQDAFIGVDYDSGTDSNYSKIICPKAALAAGDYYLAVMAENTGEMGNYSVSVHDSSVEGTCPASTGSPPDPDSNEPGDNTKAGATTLNIGCANAQDHLIEPYGGIDTFKITIP